MSLKSDVLKSDQKHLGSQQEMWFESPHRLDDAFWGITVVPKDGTSNVVLEVTGQMVQCDREGNRTLSIRIKNTGHTDAYFTLYAARSPNYSREILSEDQRAMTIAFAELFRISRQLSDF